MSESKVQVYYLADYYAGLMYDSKEEFSMKCANCESPAYGLPKRYGYCTRIICTDCHEDGIGVLVELTEVDRERLYNALIEELDADMGCQYQKPSVDKVFRTQNPVKK